MQFVIACLGQCSVVIAQGSVQQLHAPCSRRGGNAVDCKHGRDMQVWGGRRPDSPHALQELPEDAAQRPHVDGTRVTPS